MEQRILCFQDECRRSRLLSTLILGIRGVSVAALRLGLWGSRCSWVLLYILGIKFDDSEIRL